MRTVDEVQPGVVTESRGTMTVKRIEDLKDDYNEDMTPVERLIVGVLVVIAIVLIVLLVG